MKFSRHTVGLAHGRCSLPLSPCSPENRLLATHTSTALSSCKKGIYCHPHTYLDKSQSPGKITICGRTRDFYPLTDLSRMELLSYWICKAINIFLKFSNISHYDWTIRSYNFPCKAWACLQACVLQSSCCSSFWIVTIGRFISQQNV